MTITVTMTTASAGSATPTGLPSSIALAHRDLTQPSDRDDQPSTQPADSSPEASLAA